MRCNGCGAERVGLSFSVVDGNRIVVPVEAMDEGLNGGFVNVTDIGGSLSGLVSHNNAVWVDKSERIDNDFAFVFDRLDRVNYDCNRTSVERFK